MSTEEPTSDKAAFRVNLDSPHETANDGCHQQREHEHKLYMGKDTDARARAHVDTITHAYTHVHKQMHASTHRQTQTHTDTHRHTYAWIHGTS